MPIVTEAELRDRVRQPQTGMKVSVPKGTMFSPSAADFIKQWRMEVVYEDPVSVPPAENPNPRNGAESPAWDKPSQFPVKLTGDLPTCITCGTPLKHKPEHMTQLNAGLFAPKSNLRIRLRGKLDTLQALCLLIGAIAREKEVGWLVERLETLAAYCREMMSAEYNERPVAPLVLDGLDEARLRKVTHHPQEEMGMPHLTPDTSDDVLFLWLNYLRCQSREAEIVAIDTFGGEASGSDPYNLVQAMNSMSSAVYYLELLYKQGKTGQAGSNGKP